MAKMLDIAHRNILDLDTKIESEKSNIAALEKNLEKSQTRLSQYLSELAEWQEVRTIFRAKKAEADQETITT